MSQTRLPRAVLGAVAGGFVPASALGQDLLPQRRRMRGGSSGIREEPKAL